MGLVEARIGVVPSQTAAIEASSPLLLTVEVLGSADDVEDAADDWAERQVVEAVADGSEIGGELRSWMLEF